MSISIDIIALAGAVALIAVAGGLMLLSSLITGLLVLRARGVHEPLRRSKGKVAALGTPMGSPFDQVNTADEADENETRRAVRNKLFGLISNFTREQMETAAGAAEDLARRKAEMLRRSEERARQGEEGGDSIYEVSDEQ